MTEAAVLARAELPRHDPAVDGRGLPALGPRGEGWVVLQTALFFVIWGCGFVGVYWPSSAESYLAVLGFLLIVAGLAVVLVSAFTLGRAFTPLPKPRRGELRQHGIYGLVRHPVYGGVLGLALGWSLAEAPLALVPTALLAVVFDLKSRREEAWLVERYPEYPAYRERTPHRFIPFVW
jgi:protein-S-isoprenylcysteine O-methyltransferase Ste14